MLKVSPVQRPLRRIVPIAIVVVGLILISALIIQQASAQEARTLKPPFKLTQADRAAQHPAGLLPPLNAPIVMSQTFNSELPAIGPDQLGWHALVGKDATVGYTWKYAGTEPFTDTVWAAGSNPQNHPQLLPATDNYTDGMEALLVYGPLNMSDYSQAVLTMTYWVDTAPGDWFGVAVSTDPNGSNFEGINPDSISDPTLATTRTMTLNLSPYIKRQPTVWIAIYLKSDATLPNGRGLFVHNVVLRGVPLSKNYMPLVLNAYPPTPTPTPTPIVTATPTQAPSRYRFEFTSEAGGNNNPDFNRWGGDRTTDCLSSSCTYSQALGQGFGNPDGTFFKLWLQGATGIGGSGPRQNSTSLSTATNFEYSADIYVYNGQQGASYGLVFDASGSAFPGSGNPPFAQQYNYYTLELRISSDKTKVTQWQFVKVENGTRSGTLFNLPVTINQGQWHNIKVIQQGSTMSFYLNGQLIGTGAYTNWDTARRRFGLYIQARGTNGVDGPLEYFADNITVRDLP